MKEISRNSADRHNLCVYGPWAKGGACYFSIHFQCFSACRFRIDFLVVLRRICTSFWMTFPMIFSITFRTRQFYKMCVFPKEKCFSRSDGLIVQCFCQCFSNPFSVSIFIRIFHDFGSHVGSIFHPFPTPRRLVRVLLRF